MSSTLENTLTNRRANYLKELSILSDDERA